VLTRKKQNGVGGGQNAGKCFLQKKGACGGRAPENWCTFPPTAARNRSSVCTGANRVAGQNAAPGPGLIGPKKGGTSTKEGWGGGKRRVAIQGADATKYQRGGNKSWKMYSETATTVAHKQSKTFAMDVQERGGMGGQKMFADGVWSDGLDRPKSGGNRSEHGFEIRDPSERHLGTGGGYARGGKTREKNGERLWKKAQCKGRESGREEEPLHARSVTKYPERGELVWKESTGHSPKSWIERNCLGIETQTT